MRRIERLIYSIHEALLEFQASRMMFKGQIEQSYTLEHFLEIDRQGIIIEQI